jgi:hypothetical protein
MMLICSAPSRRAATPPQRPTAPCVRLHQVVRPEIAATDTGARDPEEGVRGLDDAGVEHGLDLDVAGLVHDGCSHFGDCSLLGDFIFAGSPSPHQPFGTT